MIDEGLKISNLFNIEASLICSFQPTKNENPLLTY